MDARRTVPLVSLRGNRPWISRRSMARPTGDGQRGHVPARASVAVARGGPGRDLSRRSVARVRRGCHRIAPNRSAVVPERHGSLGRLDIGRVGTEMAGGWTRAVLSGAGPNAHVE